ncbi:MAG: hypothetical protein NT124_01345 [Candidatus Dependentiae bacterium]|nr:hypothetical protein [Candidatus Dependentiae bacterium]
MTFLYNLFIDCLYVAIFCLFVPAYAMEKPFPQPLRDPDEIELAVLALCQKKELESQKQEQSVQVLTCLSLLADAQYRGDAGEISDQVPKGQTILEFMKTLHG